MSDRPGEIRLEGTVRAHRLIPGAPGKQFLGALIECDDGMQWVMDYSEASRFHEFAGRRVVVSGTPFTPDLMSQHLVGDRIAHLRVSSIRLADESSQA